MIVIAGAGAMGGMLASKLFAAGYEVALLDVSQELTAIINTNGMTVTTRDAGTEVYRIVATTNPEGLGEAEAVFIFVKAQHTASAAQLIRPLVGSDTTVVSLQNGWGNADVLAEYYPAEQIAVGVTYHSATIAGPGQVAYTGFGPTFIGPYTDGGDMSRAEKIRQYLQAAGFDIEASRAVKTEIWKKLILNAATLPTAALTGLCAGDQGQPGPLLDLVDELTAEAVQVANALGYGIELDERIERIHTILANAGKGKASMLQDAQARRKTEIEVVNGAVVRAAEKTGIAVPLNKAMVALVGGLERSWNS